MRDDDLNPRATAIMLALRPHRESIENLRRRVGDPEGGDPLNSTERMCTELIKFGLIARAAAGSDVYLTSEGIAWLEARGLRAEYLP